MLEVHVRGGRVAAMPARCGCGLRGCHMLVLALLGRAWDWPLAMKHAAGWQGDEHA